MLKYCYNCIFKVTPALDLISFVHRRVCVFPPIPGIPKRDVAEVHNYLVWKMNGPSLEGLAV